MSSVLLGLVVAFTAASFYFFTVKRNTYFTVLSFIISAKLSILFILTSSGAVYPLLTAIAAGGLVFSVMAKVSAAPAENGAARGSREYIISAGFLILLVFILGGCTKKEIRMPSVQAELEFKFIPSAIAEAGKDSIYIGSERGKAVYLYSLVGKKRKKIIETGYNPSCILRDGNTLYIANKRSNSVTVYDDVSGDKYDIKTRGRHPCAVILNRGKNLLYAANTGSGNVAVIDLAERKVIERISTGKWPSDLYLSPDGRFLYVSCKYTNTVEIIDAEKQKHLFTKIDTGISPVKMVPLNRRLIAILNEWEYAFNHQSTIIVFDTKEYSLKSSIRVDGGIFDGVLSKSKRYMYITVPLKDKVIFVDIKKRQKVYEMEFKDQVPKRLALSADGKTLYVAGQNSKKVILIGVNGLL